MRKARLALVLVGIVLVVSILHPPPIARAVDSSSGTVVHQTYTWTYKGEQFEWSVNIPMSLYTSYHSVPIQVRLQGRFDGFFLTDEDNVVEKIANAFKNQAAEQGYDLRDRVGLLLSWVQNLPYIPDSVTAPFNEYPKFPVETLVDNGGDCKDTTYLFMSVLRAWGVDEVFVNPPGHLAAGVLGGGGTNADFSGYYYSYNDGRYYYAETIAVGYQVGDIPDSFRNVPVNLYPVTVEGYRPPRTTSNGGSTVPPTNSTSPTVDPTQNGQVQKVGPAPLPPVSFPVVLLMSEFSAAGFAFILWLESKTRRK